MIIPDPHRIPFHLRRRFRPSEAALIALAVAAGVATGLMTLIQSTAAHLLQRFVYGSHIDHLSAVGNIAPYRLLALPLGGACLLD